MKKVLNWFYNLYSNAIKVGIDDSMSFPEAIRVELCNLVIIIVFPFLVVFSAYVTYLGEWNLRTVVFLAIWVLINIIPMYLNYKKKYFWAKIIIIVIPLSFLCFIHTLYGVELRLEANYLIILLFICFFFKGYWRFILCSIVLAAYFLVLIRLNYVPAPLANRVLNGTAVIYFLSTVVYLIALTNRLIQENDRYNYLANLRNKKLGEKNKALESFSYIVSHDLKSPLRGIVSFSSLIEKELNRGDMEAAKEYLAFVKTNGKEMSDLIEGVLEVSKVNHSELEKTQVDLNNIVYKVQKILRKDILDKNAIIICEGLPMFFCNELRFTILFQNIIQNGIKYNSSKLPQIEIWAEENNDTLNIFFKDNGIGIEEKYQEQIFKYFKRLHTKIEYSGNGIGLGLCKKIVQDYNGKIKVQSIAGKGSIFIIDLPCRHKKINLPRPKIMTI